MVGRHVILMDEAMEHTSIIFQGEGGQRQQSLSKWRELMNSAMEKSFKASWVLEPMVIMRTSIHDCFHSIFPYSSEGLPATLPTLDAIRIEHAVESCSIIRLCLQHWEKERTNKRGVSLFPAAMALGGAMLELFAWRLAQLSPLTAAADIAIMSHSTDIRGWPCVAASGRKSPSLRGAVSRLLMAQSMSMEDADTPELMTACIPATTALARVLCDRTCLPGHRPVSRHLLVPALPHIATAMDAQRTNVLQVLPGSAEAAKAAAAHLHSVLEHVEISGRSIDATTKPCSIDNFDGSKTLLDAVQMYHVCQEVSCGQHIIGMANHQQLPAINVDTA